MGGCVVSFMSASNRREVVPNRDIIEFQAYGLQTEQVAAAPRSKRESGIYRMVGISDHEHKALCHDWYHGSNVIKAMHAACAEFGALPAVAYRPILRIEKIKKPVKQEQSGESKHSSNEEETVAAASPKPKNEEQEKAASSNPKEDGKDEHQEHQPKEEAGIDENQPQQQQQQEKSSGRKKQPLQQSKQSNQQQPAAASAEKKKKSSQQPKEEEVGNDENQREKAQQKPKKEQGVDDQEPQQQKPNEEGKEDAAKKKEEDHKEKFTERFHFSKTIQFSYKELWRNISEFGLGLASLGIQPGARIALYEETRWEWLVSCYGAWTQGMTGVTVYANLGEDALAHVVEEAKMTAFVCNAKSVEKLVALLVKQRSGELKEAEDERKAQERKEKREKKKEQEEEAQQDEGEEEGAAEKSEAKSNDRKADDDEAEDEEDDDDDDDEEEDDEPIPEKIFIMYLDDLNTDDKNDDADDEYSDADEQQSSKKKKESSRRLSVPSWCTVIAWSEVLRLGREAAPQPVRDSPDADAHALIMYTSGTTGSPKGVIMTHGNVHSGMRALRQRVDDICHGLKPGDSYIAYLPLAHSLEFLCELVLFTRGCLVCYGNPRTLADNNAKPHGDLKEFKPVLFAGVPRIFDTMKRGAQSKLPYEHSIRRRVFEQAYEERLEALKQGTDTPYWNRVVFKQFRQVFGGNVKVMVSGGAPLSADTKEFVTVVFGAPVIEAYGLTETCCCGACQRVGDLSADNSGQLEQSVELKLIDKDDWKHTNKPRPQGEVCFRGPFIVPGYFKQAKKTKEAFDQDGWFHTGDIGEVCENGSLKIVGRTKGLAKNARGEYIALESLESVYSKSDLVLNNNVCVLVDPKKSYIAAIISIKQDKAMQIAQGVSSSSWPDVLNDEAFQKKAAEALSETAKAAGKQPFELVKYVVAVPDEWSPENGLLTAAMKLKRGAIEEKYAEEIKEVFSHEDEA